MTPDERSLREETSEPTFQAQVGRLWGQPLFAWPYIYIWVRSRPIQDCAIDRYWLRVECTNFPERAPTGTFWDMSKDSRLENEDRPWGTGEVALVFRTDWPGDENGGHGAALYTPLDHIALSTHTDWPQKHPTTAWNNKRKFSDFLNEIARLLDSSEYTGPRGSSA